MKKYIALLLSLTLLACTASALAGGTEYAVVNNPDMADRLNLRQEPSTGAKSLGKYLNGVVVRVLENVNDRWAKVQVGDVTGYMMREYLADAAGDPPVRPMDIVLRVKNPAAAGMQCIMDTPYGDYQPIVNVPDGARVMLLGFYGDHAHIQYGGITGYMPNACLVGEEPYEEETQGADSSMPIERPVNAVPVRALLITGDGEYEITDPEKLRTIYKLMTSVDYWGENIAGCLFGANLLLEFPDDVVVMELATDGCNICRYNGHDFRYAFDLWQQDEGLTSAVLFDLFGVSP